MRMLIATRNQDKYRIISKLIMTAFETTIDFNSLEDLEEDIVDKKEEGSIEERAFQKAMNVYNNIVDNNYDYIIGIDDGMYMKGKIRENVKDYIEDIINDNYLEENELVYVMRAYTFIDINGDIINLMTKIPFKYKKTNEPVKIKENSYPLSNVLTIADGSIPVAKMDSDMSNEYYLKYSLDEFKKVMESASVYN